MLTRTRSGGYTAAEWMIVPSPVAVTPESFSGRFEPYKDGMRQGKGQHGGLSDPDLIPGCDRS